MPFFGSNTSIYCIEDEAIEHQDLSNISLRLYQRNTISRRIDLSVIIHLEAKSYKKQKPPKRQRLHLDAILTT